MNFRRGTKSNLCKVTRFQIALGVKSPPFKLHGKEYIVVVDFYSDFIEVKQLQENSSSSMIEYLKEQFSRYGIPDTLVTDNGPQFTSHVSSSPHHHRSNGKVESAMRVAKSLLKKAHKDNKDPWLTMLDQRNTQNRTTWGKPCTKIDVSLHQNNTAHSHKPTLSESSRVSWRK